jgi:hypothetical protein
VFYPWDTYFLEEVNNMLFHITHVHTPETCPAGKPELMKSTFGKMIENSENGVELINSYADAPAHTLYFIVKAESITGLSKFLDHANKLGSAETRPVEDAVEVYNRKLRE